MKTKVEGSGVLVTEAQQSWIKTQLIMRRLRPLKRETPPGHPIGDWCFRLAQRGWFDAVVMACIVLNTIIMAMEYFGQSDIYTTYDMVSYVFLMLVITVCWFILYGMDFFFK